MHKFRYKNEVEAFGDNPDFAKTRIGFIADEVDPMFMYRKGTVDQVSVNGILMAAVKEQQKQIEQLEARLVVLEMRK